MRHIRYAARAWSLAAVVVAVQLACSAADDTELAPSSLDPPFAGTEWSLVVLDGVNTLGTDAPTLLMSTDGRVSGFAGCNRMVGSYTTSSDRLAFSALATTRMFCAGRMDLEQQYLAALIATRTFRQAGRTLMLIGTSGVMATLRAG